SNSRRLCPQSCFRYRDAYRIRTAPINEGPPVAYPFFNDSHSYCFMKTYISLICSAIAGFLIILPRAVEGAGDPPELLSYQSYLVDADGAPLGADGSGGSLPTNYDVVFRIFSASSGGDLLWAEQQTITIDNGYFSVLLGEGSQVGSDPRPALSEVFTGTTAHERFIGMDVRFVAGGEFTEIL